MSDFREQVASLDTNLKLTANAIVEGFISGQHKSPFHGFSVEFSDYKSYSDGDSVNLIDWKLYSKTDRYYIKRYEEETNVRTYFLIDCSKSMSYSSHNIKKIDYAKLLAATLINISLKQRDATGLVLYNNKVLDFIPAKSKSSWFNQCLFKLENITCNEDTDLTNTIFSFAHSLRKRSLIVIVTDFLDDLESIKKALNFLKFNKHHCILFHICDQKEIDFNFNTEADFIDLEDSSKIKVSPHLLKKDYINQFNMFHVKLRDLIKSINYEYCQINTLTPIEISLRNFIYSRQNYFN